MAAATGARSRSSRTPSPSTCRCCWPRARCACPAAGTSSSGSTSAARRSGWALAAYSGRRPSSWPTTWAGTRRQWRGRADASSNSARARASSRLRSRPRAPRSGRRTGMSARSTARGGTSKVPARSGAASSSRCSIGTQLTTWRAYAPLGLGTRSLGATWFTQATRGAVASPRTRRGTRRTRRCCGSWRSWLARRQTSFSL
mmetsp:Transcript_62372/g.190699  ORF Transcript_62372/g.190699 Transcript_62372/m.190699 type:complete len:201 (+) Transcript_62372:441-1043(+)